MHKTMDQNVEARFGKPSPSLLCFFLKIDLIIATLIERQLSYNLFRLDLEIEEVHILLFLLPNMFTYRCVL